MSEQVLPGTRWLIGDDPDAPFVQVDRPPHQVDWERQPKHPGWDLWCSWLIMEGLLRYHRSTGGHDGALRAATRLGDLIIGTFGDGRQDLAIPPHDHGQGPISSLLGMLHLYECTGDDRYLDFVRYALRQFGRKGTLALTVAAADDGPDRYPFNPKGAPIKHCEFELIARGVVDYHRLTADPLAERTAHDIYRVTYRPVIHSLPLWGWRYREGPAPRAAIRVPVETCDLAPLLRYLEEMFRITSDNRYLDDLEFLVYNHMCRLRSPGGGCTFSLPSQQTSTGWTAWQVGGMNDFHCCLSMGALGLLDFPRWAFFEKLPGKGVLVNWYEPGSWSGALAGAAVRVTCEGAYPYEGAVSLTIGTDRPAAFDLDLRIPRWCTRPSLAINGVPREPTPAPGSIAVISRTWQDGDTVTLELPMAVQRRRHERAGTELQRGPLLLVQPYDPDHEQAALGKTLPPEGDRPLELTPQGDAPGRWTTPARQVTWEDLKPAVGDGRLCLVPLFGAGRYRPVFPDLAALMAQPPLTRLEGARNLALAAAGATARSSSEYTKETGCTAEVIDGVTVLGKREATNRWHAALDQGLPQWIEVELRAVEPLRLLRIVFADGNDHPQDFRLDFHGGEGGDPVASILEESYLDPQGYSAVLDGVEAKRVRLTVLRTTGKYAQITELELY